MTVNNFLYSNFEFEEDEDLLKFKFKMINLILIIVAFFSILFGAMSDLGINDLGPIHSKVNYINGFFSFMLIFLLRFSKKNYKLVSHALLIASLMTFISALINVPQDEFRMIWFYLLIFVAYILNGNSSGTFYTVISLLIILCMHFFTDLQLSQTAINSGVLGLIIGSLLSRVYTNKISDYENSLHHKNLSLHLLASTDGLTGIMNKRIFEEVSQRYFETAQRDEKDLALLMLDLDHFKKVNDTYGHQVGDMILIRFAETIKPLLRKSDIFARIGGEEFALLLFKTDIDGASSLAEKIHEKLKNISIHYEGQDICITTSIGISQNKKTDIAFDEIFLRADLALYQAKDHGRNQSCILR